VKAHLTSQMHRIRLMSLEMGGADAHYAVSG
jgi:hypothetical protein